MGDDSEHENRTSKKLFRGEVEKAPRSRHEDGWSAKFQRPAPPIPVETKNRFARKVREAQGLPKKAPARSRIEVVEQKREEWWQERQYDIILIVNDLRLLQHSGVDRYELRQKLKAYRAEGKEIITINAEQPPLPPHLTE